MAKLHEAREMFSSLGGAAQCMNCGGAKAFHQPDYQPAVESQGAVIRDSGAHLRRNLPCREFSNEFIEVLG